MGSCLWGYHDLNFRATSYPTLSEQINTVAFLKLSRSLQMDCIRTHIGSVTFFHSNECS
ncbi:hypothetical protein ACIN8IBEIGE_160318 [Acinetobacter sp. 8I-beige]|nr:hypothetical protein ACIN8IBEIGE_160318 [Acinetobacter sp. 8I-beige]